MATAVLILDESKAVEYVNASAACLFAPVDPIGCDMPALLASCGATGGDEIFEAAEHDDECVCRIRLADQRLLDCTMRRLSGGGHVLSLDDVTTYVLNAELATRDGLTGLKNRKVFLEHLSARVAIGKNSTEQFSVLYLDLDRFKAVNDSLGHPVGDALLKKVADRLRSALAESDCVARLGGDEFAIIQSASSQPEAAKTLAARLVDLVGRTYVLEGHSVHVGASVGIATFPMDGSDADTLLRHADVALYRAKADGRGVYRLFESGMNDRVHARRQMETDLRRALALKEFQLAFQPQVNLATAKIVGFEALIRWQHPVRGLVSPGDFIPLAEEIGIIVSISEWVLRTACKVAAQWPQHVSVAVNLSPVQFRSGKLVESITSALAHSGLAPERLDLEVTESSFLEGSASVFKTIDLLRKLGVRVSMDDFGTGYSSLSYLQQFSFDKIKVDRSFIRAIDRRPEQIAILRAITKMADALGIKTTAEGVETEEELACVKREGCTEVQGFLTGRPMAVTDAAGIFAI